MAQSKQLQKLRAKEYKAKLKEYKKTDWKVYGTSRTLEVALLEHYEKLASYGDDGFEVVGVATKFASKNIGKQTCFNNAVNDYAQKANSEIKARIISDMSGDGSSSEGEFDRFYAAYERCVQTEIKGELKESFSMIHQLGPNEYEMQVFYIVNESQASKARIRAMENAMKESEAAQKYANKVSDFVRQGFEQ